MKPKVKLRIVVGLVLTLLSFFSIPIVTVWKKSRVLDMVSRNEGLKENVRKLKSEIVVLQYSASRLKDRNRIETLAKNECGLVYPENGNVMVMVKPERIKKRKDAALPFGMAAIIR